METHNHLELGNLIVVDFHLLQSAFQVQSCKDFAIDNLWEVAEKKFPLSKNVTIIRTVQVWGITKQPETKAFGPVANRFTNMKFDHQNRLKFKLAGERCCFFVSDDLNLGCHRRHIRMPAGSRLICQQPDWSHLCRRNNVLYIENENVRFAAHYTPSFLITLRKPATFLLMTIFKKSNSPSTVASSVPSYLPSCLVQLDCLWKSAKPFRPDYIDFVRPLPFNNIRLINLLRRDLRIGLILFYIQNEGLWKKKRKPFDKLLNYAEEMAEDDELDMFSNY